MHELFSPVPPRSPVDPLSSGRVLLEVSDQPAAAASGTPTRFSGASVHVLSVDSQAWLTLKMPQVEVRGDARALFFIIDVMAYTPGLRLAHRSGRDVLMRSGVGFRIGVAAVGVNLKPTAHLKSVAAQAELRQVGITYSETIIGLPRHELPRISTRDDFGPRFFQAVGAAASQITTYIAENENNPDLIQPQEISSLVIGGSGFTSKKLLCSHIAAVEGICHGRTMKDQLGHVRYWTDKDGHDLMEHINPVLVQDVYDAFRVSGTPNADQKDLACHVLRKGD